VDIEQEFRATTDDLGEGQFPRGGELLGPAIEIVRQLDLGFYHEGEKCGAIILMSIDLTSPNEAGSDRGAGRRFF
jgi:hypothetical protein